MSDLLPATGDAYSVGSVERRWKAIFLHNYLQAKKSLEMMEAGVDEPYVDWFVPFVRLHDSAIGGTLWLCSNHYDRIGLAYNVGLPNYGALTDLMMYVPSTDKVQFDKQTNFTLGFAVLGGLPDFMWNNSKRFSHENRSTDPNPPVDIGNHEGAIWFRNDLRILKYLAYIDYENPTEYEIRSLVSNPASENVDLAGNRLLTTNFSFKDESSVLSLRNRADSSYGMFKCAGFYSMGNCEAWGYMYVASNLLFAGSPSLIRLKNNGGSYDTLLQLNKAATCSVDIPLARNIDVIDDGLLKVGKDSDGALPTASASYRGKMIRVEGGSGTADRLYMCMKKADDSYEWTQVASG